MSSPQNAPPYTFPAPIGGVPTNMDFAPSILFAVLYAIISILGLYRFARSSTRTLCTMGVLAFVIERIVIYSLRAKQAHDPSEQSSNGLMKYWQLSYAVGYLSILTDIVAILRSLLVNTTLSGRAESDVPLTRGDDGSHGHGYHYAQPQEEDQPRARFWYRSICGNLALFSLLPVILGTIAGFQYPKAETDSNTANLVQSLRYATAGIAFVELLTIQCISVWGYLCVPRIRRSGALVIVLTVTLLNLVSVYRLIVMRFKTTSITFLGPHSLNGTASKVTFYIFHASPELLAAAILFVVDVRDMFGTGLFGDYRSTDKKSPQPEESA